MNFIISKNNYITTVKQTGFNENTYTCYGIHSKIMNRIKRTCGIIGTKSMKLGETMEMNQLYSKGDIVYIIVRNPHAQSVANVQQAAVVENPEKIGELALFIHETYYPITDELAIFTSEVEAEESYQAAFGSPEDGEYYG